jgi:hypothetical protein
LLCYVVNGLMANGELHGNGMAPSCNGRFCHQPATMDGEDKEYRGKKIGSRIREPKCRGSPKDCR